MKGGINVRKKRRRKHDVNLTAKDWHHCLFQKRHWKIGWAKVLREHPYCGTLLPTHTLHRYIHENITDIPVPDGKACRIAFDVINNWLEADYISVDSPLEQKLAVLSSIFNKMSPDTAYALRKQLEIVRNYNERPQ